MITYISKSTLDIFAFPRLSYMALEIQNLHQILTKFDVYNFGIMLIEFVNEKECFNMKKIKLDFMNFPNGQKTLMHKEVNLKTFSME
jgi:hypothetical protein